MVPRTDRLFVRPTFMSGVARLLDILGLNDTYNSSRSGAEADVRAMAADWGMAIGDLRETDRRLKMRVSEQRSPR